MNQSFSMENKDRDLFRISHIDESITKIIEIVLKHKSFESFKKNWISQDAMIRNFEIIGEASSHVSDALKSKYPDVEWNKIKGMRNLIAHEYFGVKLEVIWDTAVVEIPKLKNDIDKLISYLSDN